MAGHDIAGVVPMIAEFLDEQEPPDVTTTGGLPSDHNVMGVQD
jgi:hypothetical protein